MFTEFHSFYIILQSYLQETLKVVDDKLGDNINSYIKLTNSILDKSTIDFAN